MKTVGLLAMTLVMLALAAASAAAAPPDAPCAHGAVDDPACVGNSTIPDAQPTVGRWNQTAAGTTIDDSQVLVFLASLQDTPGTRLVPLFVGSDDTTTYSNAVAAVAFLSAGQVARARRVFDGLPAAGDPCPTCACSGAYQQFRSATTGMPRATMDPNDFWIGDNAWLLTALKQHRVVTGDQRYNGRITMLVNWFNCLENLTPASGIYSGFRRDGSLMNWRHAEGSIDVYGALKGLNAEPVRVSVKAWLDDAVWPRISTAASTWVGSTVATCRPTTCPGAPLRWGRTTGACCSTPRRARRGRRIAIWWRPSIASTPPPG